MSEPVQVPPAPPKTSDKVDALKANALLALAVTLLLTMAVYGVASAVVLTSYLSSHRSEVDPDVADARPHVMTFAESAKFGFVRGIRDMYSGKGESGGSMGSIAVPGYIIRMVSDPVAYVSALILLYMVQSHISSIYFPWAERRRKGLVEAGQEKAQSREKSHQKGGSPPPPDDSKQKQLIQVVIQAFLLLVVSSAVSITDITMRGGIRAAVESLEKTLDRLKESVYSETTAGTGMFFQGGVVDIALRTPDRIARTVAAAPENHRVSVAFVCSLCHWMRRTLGTSHPAWHDFSRDMAEFPVSKDHYNVLVDSLVNPMVGGHVSATRDVTEVLDPHMALELQGKLDAFNRLLGDLSDEVKNIHQSVVAYLRSGVAVGVTVLVASVLLMLSVLRPPFATGNFMAGVAGGWALFLLVLFSFVRP